MYDFTIDAGIKSTSAADGSMTLGVFSASDAHLLPSGGRRKSRPLIHAHNSTSRPVVGEASPVKSELSSLDRNMLLGSARFWVDGSLIEVKKASPQVEQKGGGLRGVVSGFSRAARRRLMQELAKIDRDARPIFVTLTYPAEYPLESSRWKYHFKKWCQRLHRKYPSAALVWRLEPQRRGAPHFHCLVYNVALTGDFRLWLRESWYKSVNSGDIKHLRHGTDVRLCSSVRHVRAYVGKYIAKVQAPSVEADDNGEVVESVNWSAVGRWWGVRYGDNLPFSKVVGGRNLHPEQVFRLMRFLRRYLHGQGVKVSPHMPSMVVFTEAPLQWYANLQRLTSKKGQDYENYGNDNSRAFWHNWQRGTNRATVATNCS